MVKRIDITLVKENRLKSLIINFSNCVDLKGLNASSSPVRTLGSVFLTFTLKDIQFDYEVQVIPSDSINIPMDGLLGNDFFSWSRG